MPKKIYQVYRVNKGVVPFSKIAVGPPKTMQEAFEYCHLLNQGAVVFRREGLMAFEIVYQVEELISSFGDEEITKP